MQRSIIAPAERVTNLRWGIALLLGFGILINSIDRIDLTVAGGALGHEFGLGFEALGYLFGAFGVAYALAQIPAGMLLDRYGVTLVGRIATLLLGPLRTGQRGGRIVRDARRRERLAFGLGKAPAYPMSRRRRATGSRPASAAPRPRSSIRGPNSRPRSAFRCSR